MKFFLMMKKGNEKMEKGNKFLGMALTVLCGMMILVAGCGDESGVKGDDPVEHKLYGEKYEKPSQICLIQECPDGVVLSLKPNYRDDGVAMYKADLTTLLVGLQKGKVNGYRMDIYSPAPDQEMQHYEGSLCFDSHGNSNGKKIKAGTFYMRLYSTTENNFYGEPFWAEGWFTLHPNVLNTLNFVLDNSTTVVFPVRLKPAKGEFVSNNYYYDWEVSNGCFAYSTPLYQGGEFSFSLGVYPPDYYTGDYPEKIEIHLKDENGEQRDWTSAFDIESVLSGEPVILQMTDIVQSKAEVSIGYKADMKNTIEIDNSIVESVFDVVGFSKGMPENHVFIRITDKSGQEHNATTTTDALEQGKLGNYKFSFALYGVSSGYLKVEVFGHSALDGREINKVKMNLFLTSESPEGKLIKAEGAEGIYFYKGGKKYCIGNEFQNEYGQAVLKSWQLDNITPIIVPAEVIGKIPQGEDIGVRAGSYILQLVPSALNCPIETYMIGMKKTAHKVTQSELINLYGDMYKPAIVQCSAGYFAKTYHVGTSIAESPFLPDGTLIKWETPVVYMVLGGGKRYSLSTEVWQSGLLGHNPILVSQEGLDKYVLCGPEVTMDWSCLTDPTQETVCVDTNISVTFTGEPLARVIYANRVVDPAYFKITAAGYILEEAILEIPEGSQQVIKRAYLYVNGKCLNLGGCPFQKNKVDITGLEHPIANTDVIAVQYDLTEVGAGQAPSGLNLKTILKSIVLRDESGYIHTVEVNLTGNDLIVYKSYPVFTSVPLDTAERQIINGGSQTVYRWKVAAVGGDGKVAVKQFPKVQVVWSNAGPVHGNLQLYSFKVFRGTVDITDSVNITNQNGISVKAGVEVSVITENDNSIFVSFFAEEVISEGTEKTYMLKAVPANFDAGVDSSDHVSFMMVGDPAHSDKRYLSHATTWGLATDSNGTGEERFNFIWSDKSALPHSVYSGDWNNGYLIPGLPLAPVVMDKNP